MIRVARKCTAQLLTQTFRNMRSSGYNEKYRYDWWMSDPLRLASREEHGGGLATQLRAWNGQPKASTYTKLHATPRIHAPSVLSTAIWGKAARGSAATVEFEAMASSRSDERRGGPRVLRLREDFADKKGGSTGEGVELSELCRLRLYKYASSYERCAKGHPPCLRDARRRGCGRACVR